MFLGKKQLGGLMGGKISEVGIVELGRRQGACHMHELPEQICTGKGKTSWFGSDERCTGKAQGEVAE